MTGIPISPRFAKPLNALEVRKSLGLRDDLPVVLVLGGGFGLSPVAETLTAMEEIDGQLQTLVVAGRNECLRRELAARTYRRPTRVLGFVSNMNELMAVSDLIVTKPGGLTTSEAHSLGKPLGILDPIPGQEAANSDFLLERGAAIKANRVEDLSFRIGQLLGSKKLRDMARAARKLGHPDAAETICREVINRVSDTSPRNPSR